MHNNVLADHAGAVLDGVGSRRDLGDGGLGYSPVMRSPTNLPPHAVVDKVYYVDGTRWVVPTACAVCERCWLVVKGMAAGNCVQGGPYLGYATVPDCDLKENIRR